MHDYVMLYIYIYYTWNVIYIYYVYSIYIISIYNIYTWYTYFAPTLPHPNPTKWPAQCRVSVFHLVYTNNLYILNMCVGPGSFPSTNSVIYDIYIWWIQHISCYKRPGRLAMYGGIYKWECSTSFMSYI